MSKLKTERLTALALLLLSTQRPLTKDQIGEYVGEYETGDRVAFERQFERDKNDLRELGLAIMVVDASDPENAAYIADAAGSYLPAVSFTADEKLLLGMAAGLWADADWGRACRIALTKFEAAGGDAIPDVTGAVGSVVTRSRDVDTVIRARQQGRIISFGYRKPQQLDVERRRIEPWGCVVRGDRWFLVGKDVDRDAVRVFRLSRITDEVRMVGRPGAFSVPGDASIEGEVSAVFERQPVGRAQFLLTPGRSPALRRLAAVVGKDGDADLLELPYRDPVWAARTLLGAGDAARVLTPPGLTTQVVAAAREVVHLHSGEPSPVPPAEGVVQERRKTAAPERVARILNMVAWVRSRGGRAPLAEVAAHLGTTPEAVLGDIELACCSEFGPHHETMDLQVSGRDIVVFDAQGASRPVSLSTAEAMPLVMGLAMLEQFAPVAQTEVFAGTRQKVVAASGATSGLAGIALAHVDEADPDIAATVDAALAQNQALRVEYFSLGNDQTREVVAHPVTSLVANGHRYLQAWEPGRGEIYLRLDRVTRAEMMAAEAAVPPDLRVASVVGGHLPAFGQRVQVLLAPAAREFAESVPCEQVQPLTGGWLRVEVATSRPDWLLRAVLAEGGAAEILGPPDLREAMRAMAEGFIARQES